MLSDIEIAESAQLKDIREVAAQLSLTEDELELYGKYKAKLSLPKGLPKKAKLILVTAINPTASGEGKTTVSIGLADGMKKLGKKVCLALREPSLGPVFGIKGGARGRRVCAGGAHGGHQPAFYGRSSRHHRGEQFALRFDG